MKNSNAGRAALSVEDLRAIDRRAEEKFAIPGAVLMENAGAGAARIALEMLHEVGAPLDSTCLVLCGGGGNGGDGYVVARHLALAGHRVLVVHASQSSRGDAGLMREIVGRMGLDQITAASEEALANFLKGGRGEAICELKEPCALIVDALLGTGSRPPLRPLMSQILRFAGRVLSEREMAPSSRDPSKPLGLALDLPSGLDADSGLGLGGPIFPADRTATFVAPKLGFALSESRRWTGQVEVCSIGAPV